MRQKMNRIQEIVKLRKKIYQRQEEVQGNQGELVKHIERLKQSIDPKFNSAELVPKGIKAAQKDLEHGSNDHNGEKKIIAHIKRLQASLEHIHKRDELQAQLDEIKRKKKEISKDLPSLNKELKELNAEVDEYKKLQSNEFETLESMDKEIDKVKSKMTKEINERDKLFKQKEELETEYYSKLITFKKYSKLKHDVEWMTGIQTQLKQKEEMKAQREKER